MKRAMFLLLGLLLLSSVCNKSPTGPTGGDRLPQWPMFGGNLRNTSNAADPMEFYSGPKQGAVVWSQQTDEVFFSAPSIGSDGTIYIAASLCDCSDADSGFIYAYKPDGSIKWRFKTENSNFGTGALGQDGTYFYGSVDGNFYAIGKDGQLLWKRMLGTGAFDSQFSRPAITRDAAVVIASDSGLVALDLDTGTQKWAYRSGTFWGFGVAVDRAGTIYTGTANSLLAVNPAGSLKWEFPLTLGPADVVIDCDGTIYFNISGDSLLYALNPAGEFEWTFNMGGQAGSNRPGLGPDGGIYVITALSRVSKLLKVNRMGEFVWEIELASLPGVHQDARIDVGNSVPLIDREGNIYLTMSRTFLDNLFSINQDRQVNWSVKITTKTLHAKPALSPDGVVYIAGGGGLWAIR